MEDITSKIKFLEQSIVALEAKRQRILQPKRFVPIRNDFGIVSIERVERRLERCYTKLEKLRAMNYDTPSTVTKKGI
ncbi:hypothetical protein [Vibrio harveyi]|uniref:hypothetical protein n=1 Tax=Vibrio harveyi TaxID=669 RepID=UPI0023801491|nr:hypothetical protein [Vibrio harveyi]